MANNEEPETLEERQQNEVLALEHIYDDFEDYRKKDAWKIKRPPELKIPLKPQESMNGGDFHVSVELYVKCPVNYPNVVPELKLLNAKGLSNQLVAELQKKIEDKAKSLVNEVMLFEICQEIQIFLHAHNQPPSKSFYDEMMSNQKKTAELEQQKEKQLREKKDAKKKQLYEEELQKRSDIARKVRQESKQRERLSISEMISPPTVLEEEPVRSRVSSESTNPPSPRHESPVHAGRRKRRTSTPVRHRSVSSGDGNVTPCDQHRGTTTLTFTTKSGKNKERRIQRGKCLGHSARRGSHSTVYVGMDTDTGELVAVAEWIIQWRQGVKKLNNDLKQEDDRQAATFMKQVNSCEQEVNAFMRLHHPHIVHFYAIDCQQDVGKITVNVLQEYIGGGDLQMYVNQQGEGDNILPLVKLREYTSQLLDALSFLHSKQIVHRDIRPSSMMIDNAGQLRLADYSLGKKLYDIVLSASGTEDTRNFLPTLGRGGKKCDIYQVGITLLSLAQGKPVTGLLPEIPNWLPPVFNDFLSSCLENDEKRRWTVPQLQQHSFLTIALPASPHHRQHPSPQQHKDKNDDKKQKQGGGGGGAADDQDISGPGGEGGGGGGRKRGPRGMVEVEDEYEDEYGGQIPYIPASDSASRLQNEFENIKWIGKGGFGDVIKVRNKLDGRQYAIKRIPLNPRSSAFKKKITREVKMLSRLSHENVVRYYNSWIETSHEAAPSDTSTYTETEGDNPLSTTPSVPHVIPGSAPKSPPKPAPKPAATANPEPPTNSISSLLPGYNVNCIAEPLAASSVQGVDNSELSEWSSDDEEEEEEEEDSSSEEEESEIGVFGNSILPYDAKAEKSDSGGIVFFTEDSKDNGEPSEDKIWKAEDASVNPKLSETALPKLQFLYIQMEFCEKSTLRQCIDASLYTDMDRVWRLFREIIEGLLHIHEQGMIHRDLKPVNIFLDSNDHVKIGDFGLATTDGFSKQSTLLNKTAASVPNLSMAAAAIAADSIDDGHDSSLTGKVGTTLYVSPEINSTHARTHYNQKVDIYSLGVIFFEMCYRPLSTGMERVQVLTSLRQPTRDLPVDFDQVEMPKQAEIIRWVLNHDPSKRPTSLELLKSDLMPPPQREEAELYEVLRSTIANPESRSYKHMIKAIYNQQVREAVDLTYDTDMVSQDDGISILRTLIEREVCDGVEAVFRRHGALRIHTPLLMPRMPLYTPATTAASDQSSSSSSASAGMALVKDEPHNVCFMDRSGGLVSLPYDLRVPFARWVARRDVTGPLKRYSLQPVYRPHIVYNSHPRELRACSFDVVSGSTATLLVDAECIHVVHEIISTFRGLQSRNYYLRVNHSALLNGILTQCGVPPELHADVCSIIGDIKLEKRKKLQAQTKLYTLSLSVQTVASLYRFLEIEESFKNVSSLLKTITKNQNAAGSKTKKGLHEIEAILGHIDSLGVTLPCKLALGLLPDPPAAAVLHFSGLIFQVVADVKRKKKTLPDVLAAGGRYDRLVEHFRLPPSGSLPSIRQQKCVVGVSISLDKIITVEVATWEGGGGGGGTVSVMSGAGVAGVSHNQEPRAVDVLVCSNGVTTLAKDKLVIARELWNAGIIADVVHDNTLSIEDMERVYGGASWVVILKDGDNMLRLHNYHDGKDKKIQRSELIDTLLNNPSKQENNESVSNQPSSSSRPPITFIIPDDSKMVKNAKRNYEGQIYTNTSKMLSCLSGKSRVEILGLELLAPVIKSIVAHLELSSEGEFNSSIKGILEKHQNQKLKKYLPKILDHIREAKFDKRSFSVFVLYGVKDDSYKLLM